MLMPLLLVGALSMGVGSTQVGKCQNIDNLARLIEKDSAKYLTEIRDCLAADTREGELILELRSRVSPTSGE